ncbi:hypothetical protein [Mesorhizobium sp.]|uniref:hypothetical protein n=2 Tax=Mesorhizobium TaxID=68287 RepID=UPI000FE875F8|nr:hypothetical protein [Mesorhizobium sp.]RWI97919.1 MAG: DUF768 domain-containing protein [Mesorhizobium sp.]TIQ07795.1 MAG: DUF768 domain-containing protein [Mesorhizobium sp.]TIR22093.1 MAG: DUF768 domain-containing protein [Mesorhizobium sp.]
MSTRGKNFLDKSMAEHVPNATTDDPLAIIYLSDAAMEAAGREGISPEEIEDVGSLLRVILTAMQHRRGGLAD